MRPNIKRVPRKRSSAFAVRKRFCRFCVDKIADIDYKDVRRLESFIRERGKIASVRASGNCAKHQRMVTDAVKKARYLLLLV